MGRYPDTAVERAMKVQEVILRAIDGRLKWFEAAEILGVSCRTMHRLKLRYHHRGYDGLIDRRRRTPSDRRVPLETVERVLRLYRGQYAGFNIRHYLYDFPTALRSEMDDLYKTIYDLKKKVKGVEKQINGSGSVARKEATA